MFSNTCIVILGPTAVGKTAMAIEVAKHFKTRIVSADSRQCYKELNIGVAKPTQAELAAVPHYFINSHSIFEDVNAAAFEDFALRCVNHIFFGNTVAVLVGGTGLYIKAFCEGMDPIPQVPVNLRNDIISSYDKHGLAWLQAEVKIHDPEYFESGEINNPQRLMRALEVKRATGLSITSFHSSSVKQRPFRIIKIGLELPREQLYDRINHRVTDMMEKGLLEEVHRLEPTSNLNALQTVGYKELFAFLRGAVTLDEAVEGIKVNTRHYAKRQMTWFKKDPAIKWFPPNEVKPILSFINTRISTT